MYITELFDQPSIKWKWDYKSVSEAEATFVVGDIQYRFYAYTSSGAPTSWDVEFRVEGGDNVSNRFGITGTGNAAIVMSTVVAILKEFLQIYKNKVTKLTFSAKERSRIDLYARMVRRLLPTWTSSKQGIHDFTLTAPT